MGNRCHLAFACDVYDGVFLCFFFLDEILNLIESVAEGFPSYFCPKDYLPLTQGYIQIANSQ